MLLDFSADFLIALAMACFGCCEDEEDGVLIGYRHKHARAMEIPPFPCDYNENGEIQPMNIPHGEQVDFYVPPYVTARQRIQRGVFFVGGICESSDSSINIPFVDAASEIKDQFELTRDYSAEVGEFPIPDGKAIAIVIPSAFKRPIRNWLKRCQSLDEDYVYPESLGVDLYKALLKSHRRDSQF